MKNAKTILVVLLAFALLAACGPAAEPGAQAVEEDLAEATEEELAEAPLAEDVDEPADTAPQADPTAFVISPATACPAAATLLLAKDFQSGEAEGLVPLFPEDDFQDWEVLPEAGNSANYVLYYEQRGPDDRAMAVGFLDTFFDNATLSYDIKLTPEIRSQVMLNWQNDPAPAYIISLYSNDLDNRLQLAIGHLAQTRTPGTLNGSGSRNFLLDENWHHVEVSINQGELKLSFDGQEIFSGVDETPISPVSVGFSTLSEYGGSVSIDNVVVCGND